jgi:hypothetical protein
MHQSVPAPPTGTHHMATSDSGDAIIVFMTFIPLLIMLIHSICSDQSFEFES